MVIYFDSDVSSFPVICIRFSRMIDNEKQMTTNVILTFVPDNIARADVNKLFKYDPVIYS